MRFRTTALALALLASWGVATVGVKWLVENTLQDPPEAIFTSVLESPGDLDFTVERNPERARKAVESLWETALHHRASGERADTELEKALRLSQAIDRVLGDPSWLAATRIYEGMDRQKAAARREADRRMAQAESDYGVGQWEKAETGSGEALDSYRELGDNWGELRALHLLGNICWVSGETDEAEAIYSDLRVRAGSLNNRYREAAAVNNLALVEEARGRFREAASGYRQVLRLGQAHGLERMTAFAFLYLGSLYHDLGLIDRAVPALGQAEKIFNRLGERRLEAVALTNRATSLHTMGKHQEALAAYRRALSLREQERDRAARVRTLIHVAELLNESGESEQALAVLEELMALTRGSEDPVSRRYHWASLVIAGDIHLAGGRRGAARQAYQEAEAIASQVGRALERVETRRRRARLFLTGGEMSRAVEELEQAVEEIEALRASPEAAEERIRFLVSQESVYEDLAGIYLERLEEPQKGLELLERSRSRAFLDSLQGGAYLSSDEAGQLRVALPAAAQPESVERVVAQLPADGALLHYTVASRWLAILAFDRRGLRSWYLEPVGKLELGRLVEDFVAHAHVVPHDKGSMKGVKDAGRKLAPHLLEPVAAVLATHPRLVIVPDGLLFQVPWGALPYEGKYLMETHEILLEPSASVFARITERKRRLPSASALVVANPSASPEQVSNQGGAQVVEESRPFLHPLPDAESEARDVAALFPGSTLLLGPWATERAVRSEIPRHGIVHFGAHAQVVPDLPLVSPLLLSGGEGAMEEASFNPVDASDGVLTGYEALSLHLQPGTLVSLAACQSIGSGERLGEGVVGLAQAFLEAGAGSVVASLWSVEDRAARELMVRFYRKISSSKTTTAGALAEAQSEMARGEADPLRRHPFYWAGFVLIGDGR